jgi:hypothetical protein
MVLIFAPCIPTSAGRVPANARCGMALQPEGTRFAMLRHMISNPLHVIVMVAAMLVLMAVAMMILR